ncbi:hypothetical protein B0H65DRAFT_169424 [Neurospora tetraspora]|uniref:Uncharacterized protein n=1 Tax=Neurospora tetraspora TaxID=94610 RepID=A0AAE0MT47_9PEZI|nr:hypothetical protein B0H65DRAFT_169424 [Neurospora tetraspora]
MDDEVCPGTKYWRRFRAWVQQALGQRYVRLYRQVFHDMVVCLSDQQLVTGIAFLAEAILRMYTEQDPITVYHFDIINYLARFSCNTHLLSMQIMRFIETKRTNRR